MLHLQRRALSRFADSPSASQEHCGLIGKDLRPAIGGRTWSDQGPDAYLRMTKFFGKLFLINFAVGVVTELGRNSSSE